MRRALARLSIALCLAPGPLACGDDRGGGTESTGAASTTGTSEAPASTADPTADPGARFCEEQCRVDADCTIEGSDIGFRCLEGTCAVPACTGDDPCVAVYSGWLAPCAGPEGCGASEACVEVDGAGRCALVPSDAMTCAQVGLGELTRAGFPGGESVTVCGNGEAKCLAGRCEDPCESDSDCVGVPGTPSCDAASGACVCSSDADCQSVGFPGFVACLPGGQCGCAQDSDCSGDNTDRCFDGVCGCSSQSVCTAPAFDNTSLLCE